MKSEHTDNKLDMLSYVTMLEREYSELQELLVQRDNEINALKHMLDRKDEEKMRFVITRGLSIPLEDNDYTIRVNLPTPKRAKLPKGWIIKGGRVEHD